MPTIRVQGKSYHSQSRFTLILYSYYTHAMEVFSEGHIRTPTFQRTWFTLGSPQIAYYQHNTDGARTTIHTGFPNSPTSSYRFALLSSSVVYLSIFRPSGLFCDPNTEQRTLQYTSCKDQPFTNMPAKIREPQIRVVCLGWGTTISPLGIDLYLVASVSVSNRTNPHRSKFTRQTLICRAIGGRSDMLAGSLQRIPSTYASPFRSIF